MVEQVEGMKKWGIEDEDVTLFFFSGHEKKNGIGCVDGSVYSYKELKKVLDQLQGTIVVILQCCYAGAATEVSGAPDEDLGLGDLTISLLGFDPDDAQTPSSCGPRPDRTPDCTASARTPSRRNASGCPAARRTPCRAHG